MNYNNELGSRTYVCLLDSSSAFDIVWHAGLLVFITLHRLSVRGKTLRVLHNSFERIVLNVVLKGKASGDVPIQSVRQGSLLGPWFHMLYTCS